MKLFAFWPILILLSIPDAVAFYYEIEMISYVTEEECLKRLPILEEKAYKDEGFKRFAMGINRGVMPQLTFSRECINKTPMEYREELFRKSTGPGSRT